jgi:prophage regulatory protein
MNLQTPRFLRIDQLVEKIGLGKTSIYERLNRKSRSYDPDFPVGVHLGSSNSSRVVWLEEEVNAWMIAKLTERQAKKMEDAHVRL